MTLHRAMGCGCQCCLATWGEIEDALKQGIEMHARINHLEAELTTTQRDRDTARTLAESAELRCQRLGREVEGLHREIVDTTMVAEAIITAPTVDVGELEAALLDAIEIAGRMHRRGWLERPGMPDRTADTRSADLRRLVDLRKLVTS